jgi:adenylate cyclase
MAPILRVFGFKRFDKNPRWCSHCFNNLDKRQRGGAVVEISMLFADVRGSTPMAEALPPAEFHARIDRFYVEGTRVLIGHDALIERFMGDQIVAYFVPSFAGSRHPRRAIDAGLALLRATGHGDPGGAWIPAGVGVHTGEAFVGTVGDPGQVVNFTALGDAVNLGARLASAAADGELMLSEAAGPPEVCRPTQASVVSWRSRESRMRSRSGCSRSPRRPRCDCPPDERTGAFHRVAAHEPGRNVYREGEPRERYGGRLHRAADGREKIASQRVEVDLRARRQPEGRPQDRTW